MPPHASHSYDFVRRTSTLVDAYAVLQLLHSLGISNNAAATVHLTSRYDIHLGPDI